jgi:hypothetical protein
LGMASRRRCATCGLARLLSEAHESDLNVASEVMQARVTEALKVGAETLKASWRWASYQGSPRQDNAATPDCHLAECFASTGSFSAGLKAQISLAAGGLRNGRSWRKRTFAIQAPSAIGHQQVCTHILASVGFTRGNPTPLLASRP